MATSTLTVAVVRDITPPIIAGEPTSGTVTDDIAVKTLTTMGLLSFSDADLGDHHKVSVLAQSGDWGKLTAVVSQDTTGAGTNGVINWTYKLNENTANTLQSGQTHTDEFTVTVDDGHGGTATQEVAVIVNSSPYVNEVALPSSIDTTWNRVNDPTNPFMESLLGSPMMTLSYADSGTAGTSDFAFHHLSSPRLAVGSITGLNKAVESLKGILGNIKNDLPDLFNEITQDGMLVTRLIISSTVISNHSWGIAIDLKIDGHIEKGSDGKVYEGIADIIPYFNAAGWVSGAAWQAPFQDDMHFEVSKATLLQWYAPTFQSGVLHQNGSLTLSGRARSDISVSILDGSNVIGTVQSAQTPNGTDGLWKVTTSALSNTIHTFTVAEKDTTAPTDAPAIVGTGVAVVGTNGADFLTGGAGNDLLIGGAGADTFAFNNNFGKDTVADFQPGHDIIQFNPALFVNFMSVLADSKQVGADTIITSANNAVTLQNVALTDLNAGDFRFV